MIMDNENGRETDHSTELARFFSEAGMLKRTKRTGYAVHGSGQADTVAEHSYRAMLMGYIIALQEGADTTKVLKMLLFHDLPETRLGDLHKIAAKYVDKDSAEKQIAQEQAHLLPDALGQEFLVLLDEFNTALTLEAKCAKDADKLELAFQAKEFADTGNPQLLDIVERTGTVLKTKTAQRLYAAMLSSRAPWWAGLKKPVEESY